MNSFSSKIVIPIAVMTAIQATALASVEIPAGQDSLARGRITSIDKLTRIARIELDSVRFLDGTELNFGQTTTQAVELPKTTRLNYFNNLPRWLTIHELAPGTTVSLTVRPKEADPAAWQAARVLIEQQDPTRPAQDAPYPFGTATVDPDKVTSETVIVPLVFPLAGKVTYSDTFLASRSGGRRHRGQDLMCRKLTPLVAVFDGTATLETGQGNAGNVITIKGDNGWTAHYYHVNNDSPGTDDGKGTENYAFAPGLKTGDRVYAGQFVGWSGDSGNAESTAPHLHFELWHQDTKACYNAYPSLYASKRLDTPLTYLPYPELTAGKDMVRLDGYVKVLDKDRNVLVLDLLATQTGDAQPTPVLTPERRYIRCTDAPRFSMLESGELRKMNDLAIGQRVTVFATDAPKGQANNLARAWVLDPEPVAAVTRPTRPNPNQTQTTPQNNQKPTSGTGGITFSSGEDPLVKGSAAISTSHQTDVLLKEINTYRKANNLPALSADKTLNDTAFTHSVRMMEGDFFDVFDSRTGRSASDYAKSAGYTARVRAMVSSKSDLQAVAKEIVSLYADILKDKTVKTLGVGFAYLDYDPGKSTVRNYWTVLFGE